jgi:hypothetical protein
VATAPPANCTATAGQYSACLTETVNKLQNTFPPCNQLTKGSLQMILAQADGGTTVAAGPACTAFAAACPGINVTQQASALMMSTAQSMR